MAEPAPAPVTAALSELPSLVENLTGLLNSVTATHATHLGVSKEINEGAEGVDLEAS